MGGRCDDHFVRWPGLIKIGLILILESQLPDPLFEVRRSHGDLVGWTEDLPDVLAIEAFITVVVAIATIGKLVDVLHDLYGWPDVRRRIQPKRCFTEAPVTHGLIVGN